MTTATDRQETADALVRNTLKSVANGEIFSETARVTGAERMAAALALYAFEHNTITNDRVALAERAVKYLFGSK